MTVYRTIFQLGLCLQKYVKIAHLLLFVCLQHSSATTIILAHQYSIPSPKYYLHLLPYLSLHTVRTLHYILFSSSSSSSYSWIVRSVILFLNPQDEVGPSISSLVVLCSFVLLVYIVMLVLVVYLCSSSVRVVATFSGILFPLLYSVRIIL